MAHHAQCVHSRASGKGVPEEGSAASAGLVGGERKVGLEQGVMRLNGALSLELQALLESKRPGIGRIRRAPAYWAP